jgi:hypothetical protein
VSEPTVVASIVTSQEGVLLGRRHDGKPPWTFHRWSQVNHRKTPQSGSGVKRRGLSSRPVMSSAHEAIRRQAVT